MRFCATYSDSHRVFLDKFFLKTFPFEYHTSLVLERMPQKCAGSLFSGGWRKQMIQKQVFINKMLTSSGELSVFCDVDISFYGNLTEDLTECLGENDIAFMKDHNNSEDFGRCGGFFIVKPNLKTRKLFSIVLSKLSSFEEKNTGFLTSEQHTINSVLKSMNEVKWTYLPERYYTHGLYKQGIKNFSQSNQKGLWWDQKDSEEKENIYIPENIKIHHANWAKGVKNKIELLDFVYKKHKGG